MKHTPPSAIFVERDNTVYYVTNWQKRRTAPTTKAEIIKLSARHLQRYRDMKAKGRSPKSTWYYVFGKVSKPKPPTPRTRATDVIVAVPLSLLNAEQIHQLIRTKLGRDMSSLCELPLPDLRRLYLALSGKSDTKIA